MITYRVRKCRHARCMCHITGEPWRVVAIDRHGFDWPRTVSSWPGHSLALDAALELAGLAKPQEATC